MCKRQKYLLTCTAFLILLGTTSFGLHAYDDESDSTGTNPINFRNDFRIYNEYVWLNTRGDGKQNVRTVQYRQPFADDKWQFRIRARHVDIEADLNNNGIDDLDDSGEGVVDFRFLTVPYMNMEKKHAIAVGLETFLPTGNNVTGSDTLSLGPQVFAVFFTPFGIANSLISPTYQYKFSIDEQHGEDELRQSVFDVFFVKQSADKQKWVLVNPTYVVDHETHDKTGTFDVEMGMMLDKYLGTRGHSTYIRPSVGFGGDRATDGSLEVGYKVVW